MRSVLLATMLLLSQACIVDAEDGNTSITSVFSSDAGCSGAVEEEEVLDDPSRLCIDVSSVEAQEVFIHTRGQGELCDQDLGTPIFTLYRDEPIQVFLYGLLSHRYCINVRRLDGYLTISHPDGTVTREENVFTWCVHAERQQPQKMTVRSLTAQAEFMILVP